MLVMRPMQEGDLDALETFAFSAYTGITSLPRNRQLLEERIASSVSAISENVSEPGGQCYYFILEDTLHQSFAGVSGIYGRSGYEEPLHFYRISSRLRENQFLPKPTQVHLLEHVEYQPGPTEICSLYLMPDYRKGGLGRLLSLSRFLFIALHPSRFTDTVIAQMRGVIHKHHYSPFWEYVGRPFANIEFREAMRRLSTEGRQLIADCLPSYPIYVELLHPEARAVIGKPHHNTRPALNLLQKEGFRWDHEVDIFDAGPKISADTQSIRSIREIRRGTVVKILDKEPLSQRFLISNTALEEFRVCFGHIKVGQKPDELMLGKEVAEALKIDSGSPIQYVSPFPLTNQQKGATHEQESTSLH